MSTVDINKLLDEIIKETGLTQEELSEKLNYNRAYLSQARAKGTDKLYDKLLSFQNEFRKSKLSNLKGVVKYQTEHEKQLLQAIVSLTNSTELFAASAEKFADSNLVNAKNIERLLTLLSQAGVRPELPMPGTEGTESLLTKKKPN